MMDEQEEIKSWERLRISSSDLVALAESVEQSYWLNAIAMRPKDYSRVIYFVQGEMTRLIKVGQTKALVPRLRALQAASPDRLVLLQVMATDGRYRSDNDIHMELAEYRVWGEWFGPEEKVMKFITALDVREIDKALQMTGIPPGPISVANLY